MKWIIGFVVLLIAGWLATVYVFKKGTPEKINLAVVDSSQALPPLPDSTQKDTVAANLPQSDTLQKKPVALPTGSIDTKGASPAEVVAFAKTQMGVRYLYGSTDPAKGFDCSGFITYVFKHFEIVVPRSSIDFTHVGKEVAAQVAKPGDLILFTGTDSTEHFVGHMGIVVDNSDTLHFIHSTSGRQYGVTITPLNDYYKSRYVKTIRVFPQNG